MALSETTINTHNIKRAEVFAKHGLGDHDIAFAHPNFEGAGAGGDTDCILCGHKHIVYQFSIRFDAPDAATALAKIGTGLNRTEEVNLKYVGSKCITDWLDAVPESAAKLEALKRWDKEMKKCKAAKTRIVCEKLCAEAGFDTPEAAYDAYAATSKQARYVVKSYVRQMLYRNAFKVKTSKLSRGTLKKWLAALATVLAKQAELDIAPEKKTATMTLLEKADEVFQNGWHNNIKKESSRKAFLDIRSKAKKYALSSSQESYLAKLIEWSTPKPEKAEQPKVEVKTETKPVGPLPGTKSFVSASGLVGARY